MISSPKLTLYLSPGACSLASHIALHESGLPFSTSLILARRGFPSSHLHLNPEARVPILEFDGELITETPAILSTIAALAPEKELFGKIVLERARCQEWVAWLCGTVHGGAFGCLFRPGRFVSVTAISTGPSTTPESVATAPAHSISPELEAVKKRGREWAEECFVYIEKELDGKTWAVGDAFTVADAYLLVFYRWGNLCRFKMRERFPNYARVVDGVVGREGCKRALEGEGGISALFEEEGAMDMGG